LAQSSSLVVPEHPAPERQFAALAALSRGVTMKALLGPEWIETPVSAAQELLARLERAVQSELRPQQAVAGASTA
jgi:hypothetical protein